MYIHTRLFVVFYITTTTTNRFFTRGKWLPLVSVALGAVKNWCICLSRGKKKSTPQLTAIVLLENFSLSLRCVCVYVKQVVRDFRLFFSFSFFLSQEEKKAKIQLYFIKWCSTSLKPWPINLILSLDPILGKYFKNFLTVLIESFGRRRRSKDFPFIKLSLLALAT